MPAVEAFVISTFGFWTLAICWAIARMSLHDFAEPIDAQLTRKPARRALIVPLLAFSANFPGTLSFKVPCSSAAFCTLILPDATASYTFPMHAYFTVPSIGRKPIRWEGYVYSYLLCDLKTQDCSAMSVQQVEGDTGSQRAIITYMSIYVLQIH